MGLQTLQNYRDILGATGTGALQRSNIGNTLVDKWVNQATREFGYALKFHELEATIDFDADVGVTGYRMVDTIGAPDFRAVEELWVTNLDGIASRVRPETRTRYKKNLPNPLNSDAFALPQWYHRFADRIWLRPVPDQEYSLTLDYHKILTPFVNPSDVSPFTEDWDEIIEVGALYRGFRHFGEFDRYQNVRNDFIGLVRSRQSEHELEEFPDGGISPIGPNDTMDVEENQ